MLAICSSKARYEKIYTLIQDSRPTATASRNIAGLVPVEISTSVQQYLSLSDSVVLVFSPSHSVLEIIELKKRHFVTAPRNACGDMRKNSGI